MAHPSDQASSLLHLCSARGQRDRNFSPELAEPLIAICQHMLHYIFLSQVTILPVVNIVYGSLLQGRGVTLEMNGVKRIILVVFLVNTEGLPTD